MKRAAKIVLGVVATPVAALAVAWGIGHALPVAHVASVERDLDAEAVDVWSLVSDPGGSAAWRGSVASVERLDDRDGMPAFREQTDYGPVDYVQEVVTPPTRVVTRIVDNEQFGGTWEYVITPTDGGTRIVITERGEIYSPMMRTFANWFFGLDSTLNAYADDLTARLASGA